MGEHALSRSEWLGVEFGASEEAEKSKQEHGLQGSGNLRSAVPRTDGVEAD